VNLQSSSKQAGENKRELKTRMNHLIQILVEENIKIEKEEVEHIKDVIGKYSHKNNSMIEDLEKEHKILENKNKLLDQNKDYLEKIKEELKKYNVFYEENNNAINTLKIDLNNINYQVDLIKEDLEYSSFKECREKLREEEGKLTS